MSRPLTTQEQFVIDNMRLEKINIPSDFIQKIKDISDGKLDGELIIRNIIKNAREN